jgi:alkylation response protein AidB-like acyl-CoA dehydrogenase
MQESAKMDFIESEQITALRANVRRYVERECPPEKVERWDREDFIPREELQKLGELGICGVCIPEEYGGLGHNVTMMVAAVDELARCSSGLASCFFMCAGDGDIANLLGLARE